MSHLMPIRILLCVVLLALSAAVDARGQEWGDFTGRFVLDGTPPAPAKIDVNKDQAFCGKFPLVDESLLIGKEGGIQDIVVFLSPAPGATVPIHPSYDELASMPVRLDNLQCRFVPRVCVVWTKQTVLFGNKDVVGHNTKVDTFTNAPINPNIPAGADLDHQFTLPERLPARVSCSIHPWMTALLVIKDHPYAAATDENGQFTLRNVPAGQWDIQFWHEKSGYVSNVIVDGRATEWTKGKLPVQILPGKTLDLGTVKVGTAAFEK